MSEVTEGLEEAFELPPELAKQVAQYQPPPLYKLPRPALSHSQVDMYLRCARQYYFRYIKDEIRPPGIAMSLGTGVHKSLELTHNHIVDHGQPAAEEQLLTTFSEAFDRASEDIPKEAWTQEETTPGALKDEGVRLVRLYNAKVAPQVRPRVGKDDKGKEVRGIEQSFSVLIAGIPVIGFIDLIDTNDPSAVVSPEELVLMIKAGKTIPETMRTVVADLKTKQKSFSQGDVDGSLQLTLYSYVTKIPTVRFDQLLRQKVPKVTRISATRRPADYLWLQEVYTGVAEAITKGVFPPCSPTEWVCSAKWCGYWSICRGRKR